MRNELNAQYFEWLCKLVDDGRCYSYQMLLHQLHNTPFHYDNPMDENRLTDGEDLRYRFGREVDVRDPIIAVMLDNRPGSVLEVMVALAVRCEEHIMENDEIGDRTWKWFWKMVESLGLRGMHDARYDTAYVRVALDRFMDRKYDRNGHGGLFTVENTNKDMRDLDIWYQMCTYLETIL